MPELPEVEALRIGFISQGLDSKIMDVTVLSVDALRGTSVRAFSATLTGKCFSDVLRHGKMLFARLNGGPLVVMHFGMTGNLVFFAADESPPPHARIVISFEDGGRLAFDNQRRFGSLELTNGMRPYLDAKGTGTDALSLSEAEMKSIISTARGRVKSVLMDQSKLAGIGNVYSDEILFQARVRPAATGTALSEIQLNAIYHATRNVLTIASRRLSEGKPLPSRWLANHRAKGETCPRCGSPLVHAKNSGRTAWYCASCQGGDT